MRLHHNTEHNLLSEIGSVMMGIGWLLLRNVSEHNEAVAQKRTGIVIRVNVPSLKSLVVDFRPTRDGHSLQNSLCTQLGVHARIRRANQQLRLRESQRCGGSRGTQILLGRSLETSTYFKMSATSLWRFRAILWHLHASMWRRRS